jgi:hypothetical protein
VAGYGHRIEVTDGEDPAAFQIPAEATRAVAYQVWKAPRGFSSFAGAQEENGQVYFQDPDGTRHPATLVGSTTTRPRAVLPAPVPANGNPNVTDTFLYTTAPISVRLRGVAPGDALGLTPVGEGGGIFDGVKAIDCGLPVLTARVDVRPGSRQNTVHPENAAELVPVRVFGRPRLNVRRITEVHLGEAAPAAVPPAQRPSLRPRDVNRDGHLDRLYYFRQGDTEITCIATDVKVTGLTSDRKRFQGTNHIVTTGCAG